MADEYKDEIIQEAETPEEETVEEIPETSEEVEAETPAEEETQENLETHEDEDEAKWEEVFSRLNTITERLDSFEKWVNETLGGMEKANLDEAESVEYDDGDEASEVAALDKAFYERQKNYLRNGGY